METTGLPKLGTTFTVDRVKIPYGCTFQFCGCTPGRCKKCTGSAVFLGAMGILYGVAGTINMADVARQMDWLAADEV